MKKTFAANLYDWLNRCAGRYWLAKTQILYRPMFGGIGARTRIIQPLKLRNVENVRIGRRVTIANYVWLASFPGANAGAATIVIGDGCQIGHFNHITSVNRVEIGSNVLTADRVHISDNTHGFDDPAVPVMHQPVSSKGPVVIGEGTWIGENVSILSCRIGRNCVIGANSVVIRDIPDHSVAAGVPARVIKQFDPESRTWKRTPRGKS